MLDLFSLDNICLGLLGNVVASLPCEKPSYHMCIKVILLPAAEKVWVPVCEYLIIKEFPGDV